MSKLNRRDLLKVLGVTAAGTTAACNTQGPENIMPYVIPDAEYVPGHPVFYKTVCGECPAACGVTAKNINGRVTKVEGKASDKLSQGALCARGHSGLQATYNVDRIKKVLMGTRPSTWEQAVGWLKLQAQKESVTILSGSATGSTARLLSQLDALENCTVLTWEAVHYDQALLASQAVYGKRFVPRYDFSSADLIVSLDADLLETFQNPVAAGKQIRAAKSVKGYRGLVQVAPRFSLTAANADTWIAPRPGTVSAVALALLSLVAESKGVADRYAGVLSGKTSGQFAEVAEVSLERLKKVASSLIAAANPAVVAGSREASGESGHVAVALLNELLGTVGKTVFLGDNNAYDGLSTTAEIEEHLASLGSKDILITLDQDPSYTLGLAVKAKKVLLTVTGNDSLDDSYMVLPLTSSLESWGDAEPVAGTVHLQQPVMTPLEEYDAKSKGDALIAIAGALGISVAATDFQSLVRTAWTNEAKLVGDDLVVKQGWFDALQSGSYSIATNPVSVTAAVPVLNWPVPDAADYTVEVYPSGRFYDGRNHDRPWLHELPDPISTLVWDAWVEVHPDTASKLGAADGDKLTVTTASGAISLPVLVHPGQRKDLLALPSGFGKKVGTYTANIGANGYELLRNLGGIHLASATLAVKKQPSELVVIQPTKDQDDRGIAQVIPLADLEAGEHEEKHEHKNMYDLHDHPEHRWGLAVDLDSCTGCGACVTACDSENNVPIVGIQTNFWREGEGTTAVGKQLLREGREMHWLRIERYFEPNEEGQLDVRFTPAMCQQCTNAPCETVCPVYATMHTQDGLNAMVYNRCVGTRYCSNNCVYKQRRFNWMTYEWPEPQKMQLNPEVTVRTKGVMEKCTFCVQRIKEAKLNARMEGRELKDGEIVTACQQTCPADALIFGDLKDPESKVSKAAGVGHSYRLFEELNTRPAVHYLKKVTRRPLDA